ncbi:MAG: hypothetical protein KA744_16285 [Phenylobacterium sp.]|nr:hypothetical protein [Phenylobacterium sp.]
MKVMPSNNVGRRMKELAAAYPGCLGHLFGLKGWRSPFLPYALDNGAFPAWLNGTAWDEAGFLALCETAREHEGLWGESPLWVVVPDVVTDKEATKARWVEWAPRLRTYGWPLAFAVQDGMHEHDVPADADVVFLGGSTKWKWASVNMWGYMFPRLHVGRVNSYRLLWRAFQAGAESCDGTGWFRGDQRQLAGLEQFLREWTAGHRRHPQAWLWDSPTPAEVRPDPALVTARAAGRRS